MAMQLHRYYSRRDDLSCQVDEQVEATFGPRPDLAIVTREGGRLAVEVTMLGTSAVTNDGERDRSRLVTELERLIAFRGYLVSITHVPDDVAQLSVKELASTIQHAIDTLPDATTQRPSVMRELTFGTGPARLRANILKGVNLGRLTHDVLVSETGAPAWDLRRIRTRLAEKRPSTKRPGASVPYIIVLATRLPGLWVDEVAQALYGVPRESLTVDPGFLASNPNVSAVLWVPGCQLNSLGSRNGVIFPNWAAAWPLDLHLVPWALRAIEPGAFPPADHVTFADRTGSEFSLAHVRDVLRRQGSWDWRIEDK